MLALLALILVIWLWPFYSVPTGSRGVVTQFGKIVGIEGRARGAAAVAKALNFQHPRRGRRYRERRGQHQRYPAGESEPDGALQHRPTVAEVFEKYSHDGNLSSYVQTATQEIFKAVTARYTAPDLIAQRAKVSGDINAALRRSSRNTARR